MWKFADDGMYVSPYFTGDEPFKLSEFPEDTARASTMEAKVYSLRLPGLEAGRLQATGLPTTVS